MNDILHVQRLCSCFSDLKWHCRYVEHTASVYRKGYKYEVLMELH